MLVLSRKMGERVIIGSNIIVTVLEVRGERVKLGFKAPLDTPIHREEIARDIHAEEMQVRTVSSSGSPFYAKCA